MTTSSYELIRLDAHTFEHLANTLALRVLGAGHTTFGPGQDGGRDGFFEGSAPYPSATNSWSGRWYIQSKFHAPHLSKDPQKWLVERIKEEIASFKVDGSRRVWPDNWIIVTNIDPSGAPETGAFDRARELVLKSRPELAEHFHIWGGRKILDLLALNPEIYSYYGEFLTPGQVLASLYERSLESHARLEEIVRYLVASEFTEHQYTKLEQAGSTADNRPGIERLFVDIPFECSSPETAGMAAGTLALALAQNHAAKERSLASQSWKIWHRDPARARTWFIKGGPGQGKSTLTQYICQIHRAALILGERAPAVNWHQRSAAERIRETAQRNNLWPLGPRIPVTVELKEFAQWFGNATGEGKHRVLLFLAERLTAKLGEEVKVGTLRRAFGSSRWLFVFDGLDEVPSDVKDGVAKEITHFSDDVLIGASADAMIICTSRPQGYSGQFASLDATVVELTSLSPDQALGCAIPLLTLDRSESEGNSNIEILRSALQSKTISAIVKTPLQAHIMAVIVRDGGKPPERRWQLFDTFYQVIKKREANRNLPNQKLAKLLREGDKLLKALHNRLGFELHRKAETGAGAVTSLARNELRIIIRDIVSQLQDEGIDETVSILMEATTERLVLVNTPENGEYVRFDIRPLQEFFASEHIYQSGESDVFVDRVSAIAGDSHWREVMHFLLSALVENNRKTELASAITVLRSLDDGSDCRALDRRLARGGIIVARLLGEGVLEPDKRVRGQFRDCLLPLLGCFDAQLFLSEVRSTHSLSWLAEVLITFIREHAESETIGAAIAVAFLIDDPKHNEIMKNFLLSRSASYQAAFFETIDESGTKKSLPDWVTEVALRFFLRDDWFQHDEQALWPLRHHLRLQENKLRRIAVICNLPPDIAEIAQAVFGEDLVRGKEQSGLHLRKCGVIEVRKLPPPAILDWKSWSKDIWISLAASTGILRSTYHLFDLLRSGNGDGIDALIDSVGGEPANLRLLPRSLRSYLASDFIKHCGGCRNRKSEDIINDNPGILSEYTYSAPERIVQGDIRCLFKEEPYFAFYLAFQRDGPDEHALAEQLASDIALQQELLLTFQEMAWLVSYVGVWGKVFQLPGPLGPTLRKRVTEMAARKVEPVLFYGDIYPLELNLPAESVLLPHLVGTLAKKATTLLFRQEGWTLKSVVKAYIPDEAKLHALVRSTDSPRRVRAAARIMLGLSAPEINETTARLSEELLDLYDAEESHWYLPGVALMLSDAISLRHVKAMEAISALIECASVDYAGRKALDPILRAWREVSTAPVQKNWTASLWA